MEDRSSFSIDVPGAKLHVETLGPSQARPILMLHGGPGADSRYLRPQCDQLAQLLYQNRPVQLLYYDQRGAERSPIDPSYTNTPGYQIHVEDIEQIRLHLGLPKLTLCGYSWGGLLSLLYSLRYPDHVGRMILISPAPTHTKARELMQQNLRIAASRADVQAFRQAVIELEPTLSPEEKRQYQFALAVSGYFVNPKFALEMTPFRVIQRIEQAIWQSLGSYDFRTELPTLRSIPTLLLHGRQDVIPLSSAQETASLIDAKLVVLEQCGHVPYIEAKTILWQEIAQFLR